MEMKIVCYLDAKGEEEAKNEIKAEIVCNV